MPWSSPAGQGLLPGSLSSLLFQRLPLPALQGCAAEDSRSLKRCPACQQLALLCALPCASRVERRRRLPRCRTRMGRWEGPAPQDTPCHSPETWIGSAPIAISGDISHPRRQRARRGSPDSREGRQAPLHRPRHLPPGPLQPPACRPHWAEVGEDGSAARPPRSEKPGRTSTFGTEALIPLRRSPR